ncbi:hypothetical protein [Halpernia frigidisoli]|uniref:Uncharacterized protein n=1 Tax=Halpernia frigidisoli TaxID=1125876 RepID=A0A1I3FJ74_9FLAO|nr:hypothetical protein [Halpernia frigidisoli]SFI10951.1 hypothetical protein SAMN05443292_1402 [Halpernia frigidisoli]
MKNYFRIFNPNYKYLDDINFKIDSILKHNSILKSHLEFKKSFNLENEIRNISLLTNKIDSADNEIKNLESSIIIKTKMQVNTRSQIKSRFNPKYYLSKSQISLRAEVKMLQNNIENFYLEIEQIGKAKIEYFGSITTIESEINRYNSLQIFKVKDDLSENELIIQKLKNGLDAIKPKKEKIDQLLDPTIKELKRLDQDIEKTNEIIRIAENYRRDLGNATNTYEAREVHQNCSASLGNGNPDSIITWKLKYREQLYKQRDKYLVTAEKIRADVP